MEKLGQKRDYIGANNTGVKVIKYNFKK